MKGHASTEEESFREGALHVVLVAEVAVIAEDTVAPADGEASTRGGRRSEFLGGNGVQRRRGFHVIEDRRNTLLILDALELDVVRDEQAIGLIVRSDVPHANGNR